MFANLQIGTEKNGFNLFLSLLLTSSKQQSKMRGRK